MATPAGPGIVLRSTSKKQDGSLQLGYEGNWRDIFQNWEALAYSYPEYVESMICTFLNATTVDGYNPYRITRQGIDWEIPEPHNPWANIGYWSDHQIIYLQKLMEISAKVHPGKLQAFLSRPMFSYANVPYRIKPYADLQRDPYNTIDFNWELEREIETRVQEHGTDGKLACYQQWTGTSGHTGRKTAHPAARQIGELCPGGWHLDEYPAPGVERCQQRPGRQRIVGCDAVLFAAYIVFCKELLEQSASAQFKLAWKFRDSTHRYSKS